MAAVVVRVGLRHRQELLPARGERSPGADAIPVDHRRPGAGRRVVDVEGARLRVVLRERKAEEALLAARDDARADVEERRGPDLALLDDADRALLLDDVEAVRLAGRLDDDDGVREATDDRHEPRRRRRARGERPSAQECAGADCQRDDAANGCPPPATHVATVPASHGDETRALVASALRRRGRATVCRQVCGVGCPAA